MHDLLNCILDFVAKQDQKDNFIGQQDRLFGSENSCLVFVSKFDVSGKTGIAEWSKQNPNQSSWIITTARG